MRDLMVQDGLDKTRGVVHKVRESIKYSKMSLHNFPEIFRQLQPP